MTGKFELKKSKKGQFHFSLKATNGQIILSSEMYESKKAAENGIASVRKNAVVDGRFEVRESRKKEPYFVMKAANGEVIGASEMYSSKPSMKTGIASVRKNAPDAKLIDLTE